MKNWIIKKLGGITKAEFDSEREKFETWAVDNLAGKHGEVTPDCRLYLPFDGDDIVVVRSRITIAKGCVKGVKVAPWCRQVVIEAMST